MKNSESPTAVNHDSTRPESVQHSRTKRLREVEELMINSLTSAEIADAIIEKYGVCKGTVYNDISAVYKRWKNAVTVRGVEGGREKYIASLESLRRRAMTGFVEQTDRGPRVRGRDLKLVHEVDKDIARFNGINLKGDQNQIKLSVEMARGYLDQIMKIIFLHVNDDNTREAIINDLAAIDEGA